MAIPDDSLRDDDLYTMIKKIVRLLQEIKVVLEAP